MTVTAPKGMAWRIVAAIERRLAPVNRVTTLYYIAIKKQIQYLNINTTVYKTYQFIFMIKNTVTSIGLTDLHVISGVPIMEEFHKQKADLIAETDFFSRS